MTDAMIGQWPGLAVVSDRPVRLWGRLREIFSGGRLIKPLTVLCAFCVIVLSGCTLPGHMLPSDVQYGTLHVTPSGAEIGRGAFFARIEEADVIYLGEQHGNPYHHASQLEVVRRLVTVGRNPALGFEALSLPQTSDVMNFVSAGTSHASQTGQVARLRSAIAWDEEDERWRNYGALLEFARANKLQVAGIDLPRALRQRITRVGMSGLGVVERRQVPESGFSDVAYETLMHERLNDSHCGHAPPNLLSRLYETWVARNDAMALAISDLVKEQPGRPVVVILGWGHVANNMGVFERVAARMPGLRQVNVGFRAVPGGNLPAAEMSVLTRGDRSFAPSHQVMWLTPGSPLQAPDPCAGLERRMKAISKE